MLGKAIEITENKLREVQKYSHISDTFKARELILIDLLKDFKNGERNFKSV